MLAGAFVGQGGLGDGKRQQADREAELEGGLSHDEVELLIVGAAIRFFQGERKWAPVVQAVRW
ncbi:hypothetical protein D3C78_1971590 [compost metagenome]